MEEKKINVTSDIIIRLTIALWFTMLKKKHQKKKREQQKVYLQSEKNKMNTRIEQRELFVPDHCYQ